MKKEELELEKKCCDIARRRGWVVWKNEKNGCKGIPDRSFLSPNGVVFLVEFKKNDRQNLRYQQEIWAKKYPNTVFRVHFLQGFEEILSEWEKCQISPTMP